MTDYMSALPYEIKTDICQQLANSLSGDRQALCHALASLRATCRLWTDPPLPLLFCTVKTNVWGSRGLQALHTFSLYKEIVSHIRQLTLYTDAYISRDKEHVQKGAQQLDSYGLLTACDLHVPQCRFCAPCLKEVRRRRDQRPYKMSHERPRQQWKIGQGSDDCLMELVRSIFSRLTRLSTVRIECPLSVQGVAQGQLIAGIFVGGGAMALRTWQSIVAEANCAIIAGFFLSGSQACEISLKSHIDNINDVQRMVPSIMDTVATCEPEDSFFRKLHLKAFESIPSDGGDPRFPRVLMSRLARPTDRNQFSHLTSFDFGNCPHDSPFAHGYRFVASQFLRLRGTMPNLRQLTLRSLLFHDPLQLAMFVAQSTPRLETLQFGGDHTCLQRGDWWTLFDELRRCPVALEQVRILGTRLHSAQSEQWYISSRYDPRPDPMGDSVDFSVLHTWVTGAPVQDPRIALGGRAARVMVWNAKPELPD
jgi:hypothetical protein